MKEELEELSFKLEAMQVGEITADQNHSDWLNAEKTELDDEQLAEILKGDAKPFFVDFVGLYEGVSGNNRQYTEEAVKSCAEAMVGVNMYKGHQEPGTESWKYREPVGKITASRLEQIEVDGKRVLAAKGKAYITEADAKLRSDIGRGMAGPLSILGNAKAVREFGSSHRTITHIHKPLKSIDFCNPGTNGMPSAGVTAVVREMSGVDPEQKIEEPKKEPTMETKLTKEQLLAEYGSVITAMIAESVQSRVEDVAKERAELADSKAEFTAQKEKLETEIAEAKAVSEKLGEELAAAKKELKDAEAKVQEAELGAYATKLFNDAKAAEGKDENVIVVAAEGLKVDLVDGDLEASKVAYKAAFDSAVEKAEKIVEMAGGKVTQVDPKTSVHKKNPDAGKKGPDINKFLSPELLGEEKK